MILAKVVLSLAFMVVLQTLSIQARFFEDDVDEALFGREMLAASDDAEPEVKKYCRDREETKCETWKNQGYCERKFPKIRDLMKLYCSKTCGYCKPKAAISKCAKASGSSFGCCWDGKEKADPQGSNCRECKDVGRYAIHVCQQFRSGCDNGGITESWMTRYCPATCGLCGHEGKCEDKEQTLCPKWEKNGYCDHANVDIKYRMIKYCAKTCGICEESGILTQ